MSGIKIETNLVKLDRKVSAQAFQRGRFAMANQVGADSNRFVPRAHGKLRSSQLIPSDGSSVSWIEPYAHRQFNAPSGWHYSTPGTGPRWTDKAKTAYMGKWTKAFIKGAGM